MNISINTVISSLDTPSSLLPFFVKDTFDVTGRTIMAKNEGGKHEAREKFIEEAGTSLFWIGGIPAIRAISNKIFKNKLDTDIHFKRINSQGPQSYFAKTIKGVELGGEKLTQIQKKLAGSGLQKYKNYHVGTTAASVLINLFMLTVALPQFNQFLSRKIISKEAKEKQNAQNLQSINYSDAYDSNEQKQLNNNKVSFGSLASLKDFFNVKDLLDFTKMAEKAQLNVQSSMLLLDYGISGSRVTFVPRNNNERLEYAIKEGGIILFFYYAADWIKKGFSEISNKLFKTPIDLDYKIISDKSFAQGLKNINKKELFGFVEKEDELNIIKFIDKQLAKVGKNVKKDSVFDNFTLQMAQKSGLIDVEFDNELQKWIRHSKKYIETEKIAKLNKNLKNFYEKAFEQNNNALSTDIINKVISKTKRAKTFAVFGNIAVCCASLSFILPKIQYMIREHRTNTKEAPGIKAYQELAEKKAL